MGRRSGDPAITPTLLREIPLGEAFDCAVERLAFAAFALKRSDAEGNLRGRVHRSPA